MLGGGWYERVEVVVKILDGPVRRVEMYVRVSEMVIRSTGNE